MHFTTQNYSKVNTLRAIGPIIVKIGPEFECAVTHLEFYTLITTGT